MHRIFLVALLVLSFTICGRSVLALDLYGSLKSNYLHFFKDIEGRDGSRPYFQLSLQNREELGKYFSYKFSPYFIYDGLSEVEQQETLFDVDEAYLEFAKDAFSLRLGWLQHNWGVTEGFNPAAVMQSYRVWNPLDLTALPSPSLHATWSWSSSQFEFLSVFRRRPSQLPQANSRFLTDE
ncbi:MAG: hypothetical protein HRT44_05235 [Bdellovibrionales bacterium]|nr:hypothetical protein [Bdellovibrionales bacterium]